MASTPSTRFCAITFCHNPRAKFALSRTQTSFSAIHRPIDVATAETASFVAQYVPPGASLIEIGCGAGDVTLALQHAGYSVTAIDADRDAVQLARAKGIHSILGEWPEVSVAPVDAIVFTRSLHHVRNLKRAIQAAYRIVVGPRRLLIEDFDFVSVDGETVDWLTKKVGHGLKTNVLRTDADQFAIRIANASDPLAAWFGNHDEDLHNIDQI